MKLADFQRLPAAGWQMRERRIWNLSTNDVARVTLRQQGKVRQINRNGPHNWSLAPGSQGVINDLAVEETVSGLCQLTAAAWLGQGEARPRPLRLHGQQPPDHARTQERREGLPPIWERGRRQPALRRRDAGRGALDLRVPGLALRLRAALPVCASRFLSMATRQKGSFWRTCRVYFRRVRISVWLLILALLGALLYLNQIGLPDFAKKPLLENLRARGLDLQFSRLRLSWYHGIVAENVRFGRADDPLSPQLTLAQVQMRLNYPALARLHFQVDSLVLRQGRLVWPLAETNQAPRQLTVERHPDRPSLSARRRMGAGSFHGRFCRRQNPVVRHGGQCLRRS